MNTKRNLSLSLATAMVVSIFLLTGCGGAGNQKANEEAADSINMELSLSPEAVNLLYKMPTPFEVTMLLEQAKAGYIFDITNPVDNIGKYMTEKSKAINLGIYSADLAYSATYNHIDNTNQFLGCTAKLADELGIAGIYHPNIVEKVKEFDNNKDSLVNMVSGIFLATNDFLSKNNRNQVAVYIATGAFVEGLYLASSLNIVAEKNKEITTIIYKQVNNYNQLMSILDLYQSDAAMKSLYDEMLRMKPVFTDFGLEPEKQLDAAQANGINDVIEGVRNALIQ
ncbi:MAG: hypothetical protein IH596_12975 [Bacteroidales bacterium]|nr:hypothetical protein [Bacteroidales bacterium]